MDAGHPPPSFPDYPTGKEEESSPYEKTDGELETWIYSSPQQTCNPNKMREQKTGEWKRTSYPLPLSKSTRGEELLLGTGKVSLIISQISELDPGIINPKSCEPYFPRENNLQEK